MEKIQPTQQIFYQKLLGKARGGKPRMRLANKVVGRKFLCHGDYNVRTERRQEVVQLLAVQRCCKVSFFVTSPYIL